QRGSAAGYDNRLAESTAGQLAQQIAIEIMLDYRVNHTDTAHSRLQRARRSEVDNAGKVRPASQNAGQCVGRVHLTYTGQQHRQARIKVLCLFRDGQDEQRTILSRLTKQLHALLPSYDLRAVKYCRGGHTSLLRPRDPWPRTDYVICAARSAPSKQVARQSLLHSQLDRRPPGPVRLQAPGWLYPSASRAGCPWRPAARLRVKGARAISYSNVSRSTWTTCTPALSRRNNVIIGSFSADTSAVKVDISA